MSLVNALFGKKISKMTVDQLKDRLYDVNNMLSGSKRRLDQLEDKMLRKIKDAGNLHGSMQDVAYQELAALEGEIRRESLLYSMYHTEKMNIQEITNLKEIQERMKETPLLSAGPKINDLVNDIKKCQITTRKQLDSLKKVQDGLQRSRLGSSISQDDPQMEKFSNLINRMQNAQAKGSDQDNTAAIIEIRNAVKHMYASQSEE